MIPTKHRTRTHTGAPIRTRHRTPARQPRRIHDITLHRGDTAHRASQHGNRTKHPRPQQTHDTGATIPHKSHAAPTQPAKPPPSLMLTLQISHTFQQVGILLLAEVLAAACLQVLQLPDGVFLAKFSQYDVSVITLHSGFRLPFDGFIGTRPFSRSVSGVEMSECGFRCPHGRA